MASQRPTASLELDEIRVRSESALRDFLAERREALIAVAPDAAPLVDEVVRLIDAGGKRLRPTFCVLGFRAAGGSLEDDRIWPAAASLELLHTFALIHDDVIDASSSRRGVPTTVELFGGTPTGVSAAILIGDLAAEMAAALLRSSGFPSDRLDAAFARYDDMVLALAAGQFLDAGRTDRSSLDDVLRVAALKSSAYSVEGPLAIGAALAGRTEEQSSALAAFARPLGLAFQLRDDLLDGEAVPGTSAQDVDRRIAEAIEALDGSLENSSVEALRSLADSLKMVER